MPNTPAGNKRRYLDENAVSTPPITSASFLNGFEDVPKRRRVSLPFTDEELRKLRNERALKDQRAAQSAAQAAAVATAKQEQEQRAAMTAALAQANSGIKEAGFRTFWDFLDAQLHTRDPHQSSTVTKMLSDHGEQLLQSIDARVPDVVDAYMAQKLGKLIERESAKLAESLRPASRTPVSDVLEAFSLEQYLRDAADLAPTLLDLLRDAADSAGAEYAGRKDRDIVVVTALNLLMHARHERSSEFQTTMCIYLLACGTSRSQFDVLNHAGLTLSYSQALNKLKELGHERLRETVNIAHHRAFMIIWDNLNIAFRVGEQRLKSKDHFDSGTTATLVPLWNTEFGALPTELKPLRTSRLPLLEFGPDDLLPSAEQVREMEELFVWHIEDIIFDALPSLRARFKDKIGPPPAVDLIPLHKTEQYPLPAMHIDESSLDGTLDVLSTILGKNLKMTEEDLKAHGLVLCAGDQLSVSLLDKVSASRRDDTDFVDNVGRYTVGQLGLFHVKMAGARMTANNSWGKQTDLWSLSRVNALLARKPITAGWNAKSLPPFRPIWELILTIVLPANILDGCRIQSGLKSAPLESWASAVKSRDAITEIARKILAEHCSARRVARIRRKSDDQQDPPFENISLFNRDGLLLRVLKHAVRRGDIGAVLNVLAYWMVMFRGTGKMPKYADALFHTLVSLRRMDPKLRHTFLMNWLANLSGKANGYKEMDLLQEHQNFWAKIIYNARGSNRSWEWLSMVSVSIFVLRDVMRNVQEQFRIPHNGASHTSPATAEELATLCKYLEANHIQSYTPSRKRDLNGAIPVPSPDVFEVGSQYANTAGAFKTFRRPNVTVKNHGIPEGPVNVDTRTSEEDEPELETLFDLGPGSELSTDDLEMDNEPHPPDLSFYEYVGNLSNIVTELARCDLS